MAASAVLNYKVSQPFQSYPSYIVLLLGWYCRKLLSFIQFDSILLVGLKNANINVKTHWSVNVCAYIGLLYSTSKTAKY